MKYFWLAAVPLLAFPQVATGPAVGTHAPRFQALDSEGRSQTLQSLMGPKGLLLVFFRSADW